MEKRPLFSLVIPCYKPEKTIFRLFDSLTRQGIPKDDLEIILSDDNSGNLDYREQLKTYGFELIFTETHVDVHCPGNTRQAGLVLAKGEWAFFADQDDFFEDNALQNIKSYIQNHAGKKMYVISTIMRSYDPDTDDCYFDHVHKGAWLHGKWYSMDNLIRPYNITFKKDLYSHEDVYFNDCCLAVLFNLGTDWEYLDIPTYRWVDNPESITRQKRDDRGYLYENFNDYLEAAAGPYWMGAEDVQNIIFRNQVLMTLLHAYFYYECATYLYGAKDYVDILELIRKFVYRMINELQMTPEFIVDYVYSDAYKYDKVFQDCRIDVGFIPKTSFRDFIFRLTNVEK
ncbi:MAG: glycosyltransferase family 2 protein [Clostridiales bacterium]|nr:glycosyltransferase family 2 protein [Clostridiales bacterium]